MIRTVLRRAKNALIVGFCAWHMAAIGIYALPDRTTSQPLLDLRASLVPVVQPYLFVTSQWQNWGMFSERSVSAVVIHTIDIWSVAHERWVPALDLGFHDLNGWDNEHYTSMLRGVEGENMWPVRERLLRTYCRSMDLPQGTYIRMGWRSFEMIMPREPDVGEWVRWEPEWAEGGDANYIQCGPDDTDAPPVS